MSAPGHDEVFAREVAYRGAGLFVAKAAIGLFPAPVRPVRHQFESFLQFPGEECA
jgi:hypothetical protein